MKYLICIIFLLLDIAYPIFAATPTIGAEVSLKQPTIYNKTLTSANTEYSQTLTDVKNLTFQCRTSFAVRYAFVTGKTAAPTASPPQ